MIGEHRLFYLDFEGPVSGDRGRVTAWDRGDLDWFTATESLVRVQCHGAKWRGVLTLRHQTECQWRAEFTAVHSIES